MDFNKMVKARYGYLETDEITYYVDSAKSILIEQLYPSDLSVSYDTFNFDKNTRFNMWILSCVDELIERDGISSVISYKENGVTKKFGRSGVSQGLLDRIPRMAKAIRLDSTNNGG